MVEMCACNRKIKTKLFAIKPCYWTSFILLVDLSLGENAVNIRCLEYGLKLQCHCVQWIQNAGTVF